MSTARTYWFGRKRIGWGLSPTTWQGWACILVYCVLMVGSSVALRQGPYEDWDMAIKIVLSGVLFTLFALKYDRRPR